MLNVMRDPVSKPELDAIERFIEGFGLLMQQDGLPRIAGRMLALFIVEGGPFSFSELAERLQVSRGSISTNTRLLRHIGYIERFAKPGNRQDYYHLSDEPYIRLLDGYTHRLGRRLDLASDLEAGLAADSSDTLKRLKGMQTFYSAALQSAKELKDELQRRSDND